MSSTSSDSEQEVGTAGGGDVEGLPFSMHDLNISDLIFEDSSFARGAFGRIVKADYFGVTVCVKIIKKQRKKELSKFIYREMAALKTLSHPNLVQFIGLTERGNEFCLVTEYISGGTLRKLLKDRSIAVPWPIRVQIAVDIASAMTYLHSRKIMHRDLKSKNLLVGDNWKIKICDFGFARSIHDKKKAAALTFCGTEEYMAPEVIFGMEYDERAEVYSYGLLLCEIITRQKVEETVPRTSNTNYGLDHQEFTAHVPRDCPLELLQLAFLCTEFEPKNRPEFREITQILREIKQNVGTAPVFGNHPASQSHPGPAPAPAPTPSHAPAPTPSHAPAPSPNVHAHSPNNGHGHGHGHSPAPAPSPAPTPSPAPAPSPSPSQTPTLPPALPPAPLPSPVPAQQKSLPPPPIDFPLPPPISLDQDVKETNAGLATIPEEKRTNHAEPQNNGSTKSPPTPTARHPAPIPFRRSPSAPIPLPVPGKSAPSKAPGKTAARPMSKEEPAKLASPTMPAKAAPSTPKMAATAKPPGVVSPALPPTRSPASPSSTSPTFPSPFANPAGRGTGGKPPASPAVRPPASPSVGSTAPKSGVPVLPKLPPSAPSSASASPNVSPRGSGVSKDRPISPVPRPVPPVRAGRPAMPNEVDLKKKPQGS